MAEGSLVFQFLFLDFRLQFCYLAMLGFTQNWVTDCGYMRKVHWFFSFYSSTSASSFATSQCSALRKTDLEGCGCMRKVHRFFSFNSSTSGRRACPAYQFCVRVCKANSVAIPQELRLLLPRNARLYAKLARGLWMHEEGSLVFQFLLFLEN